MFERMPLPEHSFPKRNDVLFVFQVHLSTKTTASSGTDSISHTHFERPQMADSQGCTHFDLESAVLHRSVWDELHVILCSHVKMERLKTRFFLFAHFGLFKMFHGHVGLSTSRKLSTTHPSSWLLQEACPKNPSTSNPWKVTVHSALSACSYIHGSIWCRRTLAGEREGLFVILLDLSCSLLVAFFPKVRLDSLGAVVWTSPSDDWHLL